MAINHWPEAERPREKLLSKGVSSLSDAELLAIFLRTGVKGVSAVDLARQLLLDFGSLRALLAADQQQFCKHRGLGQAKFCQLQASVEMTRRFLQETLKKDGALTNPTETRNYLSVCLRDEAREVFAALFLDSQNRVITYEPLFYGTINAASVYPREIVKRSLALNAAGLIVAHNHPSGVAEPSQADRQLTERLNEALALVDIRLLDHMVVGDGVIVSFAERGWL